MFNENSLRKFKIIIPPFENIEDDSSLSIQEVIFLFKY